MVAADGSQVGVVSLREALAAAEASGLNLVEIAPNAAPPVCKVMNFGKFIFEQKKQKSEARKKQKIVVKEIKLRPVTEEGDYQVKLKKMVDFLNHGDKVKVTLRFRGRELSHQEIGQDFLKRVEADVSDVGMVESFPKMEGRQLVMVLAPKKK